MSETDDRVDLTDLDVFARYSLAVRAATADRAELIAALRSDLAWLERDSRPAPTRQRTTAPRPAPAKRATAGKPAAKKTTRRSR